MPRRVSQPQSRRHIFVYDDDWDWLEEHYGSGAHPERRVGCGPACREIIHAKVKELRERQLASIDAAGGQNG